MVRKGRRPKISLKPEELILAIWGDNPEEEIACRDLVNRIMDMFNVSRTTAIEYLGKLVKSGKLIKIKRGRHTYYRPTRLEDVVRWSLIGRLLTMAKFDDLFAVIIYGLWRLYEDNNKAALEAIKKTIEAMLKDEISGFYLVDEIKETNNEVRVKIKRLSIFPYLALTVQRKLNPLPLREKIKIGLLLLLAMFSSPFIAVTIGAIHDYGLTIIYSWLFLLYLVAPFLITLVMFSIISFIAIKDVVKSIRKRKKIT